MKCPYCGAELQENARFCLYCMKPLQEKTPIASPRAKQHRRKWLLVLLLAVALTVTAIIALIVGSRHGDTEEQSAASTTESTAEAAESNGDAGESTATTTESAAKKDLFPINNYNDFYFDAIFETERLAGQALWEPSGLYLLDRTEQMEVYSAPVYLQDAAFNIYYIDEGVEIFAAVTNLTEDTLAGGLRLADCINAATYYGVSGILSSLEDTAPSDPVAAGDSYIERLNLDDPAAAQLDVGTAASVMRIRLEPEINDWNDMPQQYLIYELRTRTFEGSAYYDIFLFYGQE